MLKLLYKFIWWLKSKPPLLMEKSSHSHLDDIVQFKMFAQEQLGRGILFVLYKELNNEELHIGINRHYESRYSFGRGTSQWCWSIDTLCYGIEKAAAMYNSNLRVKRRVDARELFYLTFGEELKAEFTEEPKVGRIVLLPNITRREPKIGVVSRIIWDKKGKAKKWWYIAGNEGIFVPKVKEVRGDNKKAEGFMDVSKVKW